MASRSKTSASAQRTQTTNGRNAGTAGRRPTADVASNVLDPGAAAWLALLPAAIAVAIATAVLGPPLGSVLFQESPFHYWESMNPVVIPEPTEQARFLVALTGPLLLVGLTILLVRRPPHVDATTTSSLVRGAQLVAFVFAFACFVAQWTYRFGRDYVAAATEAQTVYFTIPTLLGAAAIAGGLVAAIRSDRVRQAFARWTAESRQRAIGATLVAITMIAITMVPAITTNDIVGWGKDAVVYHLQFTFDEAMAVVNGRSPLGDFAAQYGSLWPYVTGGGMLLIGETLLVFTLLMASITAVALLGVFGVLRRLTRSTVVALLLFLPLLATSAYMMRGPAENRYSLINYFGTFPLRYAGPLFVLWLTARHLDGAWPRRAWPLFALGCLALLNNADFGVAAVGATIAALLWTGGRPTFASVRRLALQAALGGGIAIALVTALLLVRTGEAPHFDLLFRYSRVFALGGFAMLPMRPVIGFSTIIYLTYIAAIGTATVRALRGDADRLLTGLLAWSGIFGLGAAAYYMGRSHPEVLTNMFPAWGLSVTLLAIVVIRRLAAEPTPAPTLPAVATLFALGLLVCSLAQTPSPWSEAKRLGGLDGVARIFDPPWMKPFLLRVTDPGEPVVILIQVGHYSAVKAGIEDVTPYTGANSIQTVEQLAETVAMLRDEGGTKVILQERRMLPEIAVELQRMGFERSVVGRMRLEVWRDTRSDDARLPPSGD